MGETVRYRTICVCFMGALIIFLSAIKWKTGTDWPAYVDIYNTIRSMPILSDGLEPVYVGLVKIIKGIHPHFTTYVISMSVIVIGIKLVAICNLKFPLLAFILFGVNFQFNIYFVRYDLALSFVLLVISFKYLRKPAYSFILVLAAGIHKVAAVALVASLYSASNKTSAERVLKLLTTFAFIMCIFYYVNQPSFLFKAAHGFYSIEPNTNVSAKVLHRFWYLFLILLLYRWSSPNTFDRKILNLLVIGAFFYLFIGFINFGSLERIFGLFMIYEIYYLSNANINNRKVFVFIFMATMGVIRLYQFITSDYIDLYFPYETIFESKFKNVY